LKVNQLTPGPGVFASIPINDVNGDRILVRVAGMSGSGFLNPGETWTNGTDVGAFSSFPDARAVPTASIAFDANGTVSANSLVRVAFVAADASGNQGIYTSDVAIRKSISYDNSNVGSIIYAVDNPIEVVNSGETIAGVGQITGVNDYFPMNVYGQIAFVANTSSGQAIVVANPYSYIAPQQPSQTSHPATLQSYTPDQVRHAYGIDSIPEFTDSNGNSMIADGTGQTIAIIDQGNDPNVYGDLDVFDNQFGLSSYGPASAVLTVVDENGNVIDPSQSNMAVKDTNEEALDVEWAHAMAPGAKIVLIEYTSTLNRAAAVAALLSLPEQSALIKLPAPVSVVSMSLGWEEDSGENNSDVYFTTPHVTYIASSGDEGAPGDYPAFSPDVVAVGGTSLYLNSDGSYQSETGWGASNGSRSAYESQPAYQSNVVPTSMSTVNGVAGRTTPDVSFDADPRTGVQYYNSYPLNGSGNYDPTANSFWGTEGGTSLSAPCWAGLIAIVNEGRVASGKQPLTGGSQTLPALYQLPAEDFHDITSGNNAQYTLYTQNTDPSQFSCAPGYDMVTGLGSPVANLLVPDLGSRSPV